MDPKTTEAVIKYLEPILVGLLNGQKKLIIESKAEQAFIDQSANYTHTIKVVDCDP